MNKKLLISVFTLILVFVLWLSAPAPAYADRLQVLPTDWDFGDVEVGTTVTIMISMKNINGSDVNVDRVEFQAGGSGDFSMMNPPAVPVILAPGDMIEVEVAFTPSAVGYVSAVLEVESSDSIEPLQTVFLGGVGVGIQPSPVTIQAILEFFDSSAGSGKLVGTVPGESALARLFAFRKTIETAGKLIERGKIREACKALWRAYERSDGILRPPDFVEGDATAELNTMILQLMADRGCI